MSINNLEKAFVLLSIVEKAGSHNHIRAEALAQRAELEKACVDEVGKRNEAKAQAELKEQQQIVAKQEEARQNEAREAKLKADFERKVPDPRIDRAASTEPNPVDPDPGAVGRRM